MDAARIGGWQQAGSVDGQNKSAEKEEREENERGLEEVVGGRVEGVEGGVKAVQRLEGGLEGVERCEEAEMPCWRKLW